MTTGNILEVRPLRVEELSGPLAPWTSPIQVIRDRHHAVARLLATGLAPKAIADHLSMSTQSVRTLAKDPSVVELIAEYHVEYSSQIKPLADETNRLLGGIRIKALRLMNERLEQAEEGGEAIPIQRLAQMAELSSDRTGYAKRTEVVLRDGDFAAKLELARARSAKVIELRPAQPVGVASGGINEGIIADVGPSPLGQTLLGSILQREELRPAAVEMGEGREPHSSPPPSFRRRVG